MYLSGKILFMREIKLRAFAKDTNEMIPWDEFMIEWLECDDITVMQFTGLVDKNGNEIYEGDIVRQWKLDGYDTKTDTETLAPTDEVSFVEYSHHGFWISAESFGWEGEGLWNWGRLEVIGNIYETPELLKQYIKKFEVKKKNK